MAVVTKNPMSFTNSDEGATDHIDALAIGGRFKVTGVRWVGATTAAHAAILKDNDGNTIWHSVCNAANFVEESRIHFWFKNGLVVDTIDSGTVYVYGCE